MIYTWYIPNETNIATWKLMAGRWMSFLGSALFSEAREGIWNRWHQECKWYTTTSLQHWAFGEIQIFVVIMPKKLWILMWTITARDSRRLSSRILNVPRFKGPWDFCIISKRVINKGLLSLSGETHFGATGPRWATPSPGHWSGSMAGFLAMYRQGGHTIELHWCIWWEVVTRFLPLKFQRHHVKEAVLDMGEWNATWPFTGGSKEHWSYHRVLR